MNAPDLSTFSGRLLWLRGLRRLGARELGALAGLSHAAVTKLEKEGPGANPTLSVAAALAKALACERGWLAFGEGEAPGERPEDRARVAPKAGRPRADTSR